MGGYKLTFCLLTKKFYVLNCFSVKDVSDLWPLVKKEFEERLPFKRVVLNNKTHNTVTVNNLPAEFILTTDSRIRSKFSPEQLVFWFQEPIATVVLVTCEVRIGLVVQVEFFLSIKLIENDKILLL